MSRVTTPHRDVVVIGDGPAGSALAHRLVAHGVDTLLVGPDEPWRATYGTWADEVEAVEWLDTTRVWRDRVDSIAAVVGKRHVLQRPYGVIDNAALSSQLRSGVEHRVGTVTEVRNANEVFTANGELHARIVVDTTGWPAAFVEGSAPDRLAVPRQTALGVVLASPPAGPLGSPMLMDFSDPGDRPPHDGIGPTFAYALPVENGWLVEETVLAATPAIEPNRLAGRLAARLGVSEAELFEQAIHVERVDIAMGSSLPNRSSRVIAFGAAAGMIHPATGYSVASALTAADGVASTIAAALRRTDIDHEQIWNSIWPASARRTRLLHDYGLDVLLDLDADDIATFFGTFFEMDRYSWADYLRISTPPARMAQVMAAMFRRSPWRLRRRLVSGNPRAFARLLRP